MTTGPPERPSLHLSGTQRLESGLLVPVAEAPNLLRFARTSSGLERPMPAGGLRIAVYPTSADLGLPVLDYDTLVREQIEHLPFEMSMRAAAILQGLLWHGDFRLDGRRQLTLARRLMPRSFVLDRLETWVAQPDHIIFSEQALLALQRLLVLYARPAVGEPFTDTDHELFMQAVLATPGAVLGRSREPVTTNEWQGYALRGGHFANKQAHLQALGRNHHLWAHLARSAEAEAHQDACPVWDWYRATYGRDIDEDEALAMAVYFGSAGWLLNEPDARFEEREWPENPLLVGSTTLLAESRLAGRALSLFSGIGASREDLQTEFRHSEHDPEAAAWDFLPFARRPLVAVADNVFAPVSPRLLEEWGTAGTYHRIAEAARRQGGESSYLRFTRFFGELVELYVREVLARALGDRPGSLAPRVIPPQRYGPHLGKETSDAVVDCAPDLVPIEVYSGRLSQGVLVQGAADAAERDLRRLVTGKALQIATVATDLRSGDAQVGPFAGVPPERIFPIVVSVEGITEEPLIRAQIEADLESAWLSAGLEPLLLLNLDELEEMAARLRNGAQLVQLLEEGLRLGWRGNGYSFFAGVTGGRPSDPERDTLVRVATDEIAAVLFGARTPEATTGAGTSS